MAGVFILKFAWDTFKSFQPAGYALVLLFFVFGLLLYFFTRGEGEELSVILTRTVAAILLITFFKDLIEAAKEITWTLEQVISSSSFEDAQVSLMTSIHPNTQAKVMSSFFIQLPLMMIAKVIFFILNLIFSYVWVFLVASAPVIIPMMICHFFDYFAKLYFRIIFALLLIRLPWAVLSSMMEKLASYKFEGIDGAFSSLTLPPFFGLLSVAATLVTFKTALGGIPGLGEFGGVAKLAAGTFTGAAKSMAFSNEMPSRESNSSPSEKITPKFKQNISKGGNT